MSEMFFFFCLFAACGLTGVDKESARCKKQTLKKTNAEKIKLVLLSGSLEGADA